MQNRRLFTATILPERDIVNVYALNEQEARSLCRLALQNLGYNMYNRLEVYDFHNNFLFYRTQHDYDRWLNGW